MQPGTPPASGRGTAERWEGPVLLFPGRLLPTPGPRHAHVRHTGLHRQASLPVTHSVYKVALSRKLGTHLLRALAGTLFLRKSASSACQLSSTEWGRERAC